MGKAATPSLKAYAKEADTFKKQVYYFIKYYYWFLCIHFIAIIILIADIWWIFVVHCLVINVADRVLNAGTERNCLKTKDLVSLTWADHMHGIRRCYDDVQSVESFCFVLFQQSPTQCSHPFYPCWRGLGVPVFAMTWLSFVEIVRLVEKLAACMASEYLPMMKFDSTILKLVFIVEILQSVHLLFHITSALTVCSITCPCKRWLNSI